MLYFHMLMKILGREVVLNLTIIKGGLCNLSNSRHVGFHFHNKIREVGLRKRINKKKLKKRSKKLYLGEKIVSVPKLYISSPRFTRQGAILIRSPSSHSHFLIRASLISHPPIRFVLALLKSFSKIPKIGSSDQNCAFDEFLRRLNSSDLVAVEISSGF